MLGIFDQLEEKFETLVSCVVDDVVNEGKGFNTVGSRTLDQILSDNTSDFVDNMTVKECRFYLTSTDLSGQDEELQQERMSLTKSVQDMKWEFVDLLTKHVEAQL